MSAAGISSPTQSRLLRWLAYAAAATLCGISALANLKFGMSLGADRVDQMALGGASVAVDVLKAALPLLVLNLWSGRYRILAVVSAVLWIGCLSWSACSAIGFAVDSRSQVNADRTMQSVASQGSIATIGRAERQLTAIGTIRPVDVVKANLAATNVPAPVWARTKECTAITLPESYAACAAVVSLRRELAVAEVAERLEQSVAAGHAELRADKAGQAEIDPQVTALARLAGVDKSSIRTGLALLLAAVVEAGSALGFTIVALATRALPVPSTGRAAATSAQAAVRPRTAAWRRNQSKQPSAATDIPSTSGKTRKLARLDHVRSFLQARTLYVEGATCGATELYEAFRRHCQRQGLPEASQQALGRELTRLGLTKGRCSRTGRFAYLGLALNDRHKETIAADPILTTKFSQPKVQQRAAGMANGTADRNVRNAGLASRVHAMATA